MRQAAGMRPGETLEVSVSPPILITPKLLRDRVVKKGKRKVYSGEIPDVDTPASNKPLPQWKSAGIPRGARKLAL
jgi:hypothetical protein